MATDILVRKRETLFSKLDMNQDGVIDEADIQRHISGFLEKFGVPTNSPQAKQLRESGNQILQELSQLDTNSNRVITQEEYTGGITDDLVQRVFVAMNGSFFTIIDSDGDGEVTEDELVNALSRDGLAPEDIRDAFSRMDGDRDGRINRAEWDEATREMLMSSDPESPGSALLGM